MSYRKKTLRKMPGTERKFARLVNDLESVLRRLKNLRPEVHDNAMLWEAAAGQVKRARADAEELARPLPDEGEETDNAR